ncbi:hypothetical protein HPQ68_21560 [Massilia sp. erpn]|nr:DUF4214 domain-containing protein [Massilia sp. erpn]UTY59533.1 hypothetical protein HPQ68_21560 [Massilia sp. erpn]
MKVRFSLQIMLTAVLSGAIMLGNAATSASTAQFTAKLYTEGLGRIPDQSGWRGNLNYWGSVPCNAANLKASARDILSSSEFLSTSRSNHERAFRLYRAVLHRDASVSELNNTISQLNGGTSWVTVIDNLLNNAEFANRVPLYCSGRPSGWQATPPANLVLTSTGAVKDEASLRAALQSATPGMTVFLEQGATILLSQPINIPSGVVLATVGEPGSGKAPLLARIARNAAFTAPMINMQDNSKLTSVWVDGQRNRFGFIGGANIQASGNNTSVVRNLLTDSTGFTHLHNWTSAGLAACRNGSVSDNLITAYGSTHTGGGWSDGISVSCTNIIVERNSIVDATDVGIVVFRAHPDTQTSVVRNNWILNAGNSAYGGLVADPLNSLDTNFSSIYPLGTVLDFTGTQFNDNMVWSGPDVHLDFIISNGTRPWFGNSTYTGRGAKFYNNTSGSETVTAFVGISVSGMLQAQVQANAFLVRPGPANINNCGQRNVVVAPMPYANDAGSSIQPFTPVRADDKVVVGCIGH